MRGTWRYQADLAVAKLAAAGAEFTSDDLLDEVGHPDDSHSANARNNAVGGVFRDASKAGLIEAVGVKASRQSHRKGGMIRVWRGRPSDQQTLGLG